MTVELSIYDLPESFRGRFEDCFQCCYMFPSEIKTTFDKKTAREIIQIVTWKEHIRLKAERDKNALLRPFEQEKALKKAERKAKKLAVIKDFRTRQQEIKAEFWAEYTAIRDAAKAQYDAIVGPALAAYRAKMDTLEDNPDFDGFIEAQENQDSCEFQEAKKQGDKLVNDAYALISEREGQIMKLIEPFMLAIEERKAKNQKLAEKKRLQYVAAYTAQQKKGAKP